MGSSEFKLGQVGSSGARGTKRDQVILSRVKWVQLGNVVRVWYLDGKMAG